ncbi:MAG: hypothetical protein CMC13_02900 [Flavobacteriaceae bacterium]|nr:hypothetical protein [Flavobacteriaceae bacterium]|tara:strand:- start:44721 stop:45566 length:846 start_codon:yes stop_codon:yes gene_type:complete
MLKLTHIINPVKVSETSDLFVAQPVTFETMRRAKKFASNQIEVNLITTQYPEDQCIIPGFFTKTKNLDRSSLDFGKFEKNRKLPLLKDILHRAVVYDTDADYIVYTNVDIAVQPYFYSFISQKIGEGIEAFVINRRTIAEHYNLKTLAEAYTDYGEAHPGYDCFVFKKDHYRNFNLENICIGAAYVGLALYLNLRLFSQSFSEINDKHLTFHIGNDKIWKEESNKQFENFNKAEFQKIRENLESNGRSVEDILNSAFPSLKKVADKKEVSIKSRFKSFFKK